MENVHAFRRGERVKEGDREMPGKGGVRSLCGLTAQTGMSFTCDRTEVG